MKEIGGYFELERFEGTEYYPNLIALNTGRNALAYILKARQIKKIYLPYFLCDCVTLLCQDCHVDIAYYHINDTFVPTLKHSVAASEAMYIVNYYGQLSQQNLMDLSSQFGHIIVDNTHAFFQPPIDGIDTIYTCRKFFGVPDGAYLSTNAYLKESLDTEKTGTRIEHLIGRLEGCASDFYRKYQENDDRFEHHPLKKMSETSHNILRAVDYHAVAEKRKSNYSFLEEYFKGKNRLHLNPPIVPFAYPLYCKNGKDVRKKLAEQKIYVPTLWPNVLTLNGCELEKDFAQNILPLPCDQRYTVADMAYMADLIQQIEEKKL